MCHHHDKNMHIPEVKEIDLPEATPRKIIDVHTHSWPPKLYEAIARWFDSYGWPIKDRLTGYDAGEYLKERGINRWVAMAYAHKADMSEALNQWLSEYALHFPQAITLATAHPDDKGLRNILDRAFTEQGLKGIKLHCHVSGISADSPEFFPIYEYLCLHDLPLIIHASRKPDSPHYPKPVDEVSGFSKIKNMMHHFPTMRCCIPHLAMDEWQETCELFELYPNMMLDTAMALSNYFPNVPETEWVENNYQRIMYGTDFPILPYDYDREWRSILALNLGTEKEDAIFHQNAERFFKLAPLD